MIAENKAPKGSGENEGTRVSAAPRGQRVNRVRLGWTACLVHPGPTERTRKKERRGNQERREHQDLLDPQFTLRMGSTAGTRDNQEPKVKLPRSANLGL